MKKALVLLLLFSGLTFGQFQPPNPNEGLLGGGFGLTWIDGQPFYAVHVNPEFAFANMGIGLDLNLEFSSDGKLRTENFNEFTDYLSIIRYFRYGKKGDPVYFRIGALDYATLGHGSIMYAYNNSPTYDARRVGMELDIDMNQFGFEAVYGNFLQAGVIGVRGYVRPMKFTALGSIPVIGNLEIGATGVSDFNQNAAVTRSNYNSQTHSYEPADKGSVTAVGVDVGLPIIRSSVFNFDLYYDFAKILDYGSGSAAGAILKFHGLGIVDVTAKLERRINQDHYIPSYFNSMYEIERFRMDTTTGVVTSKVQQLAAAQTSLGNGWYGGLLVKVFGTFDIVGSYQRLDEAPESGILHMSTDISPKDMSFIARAGYDKINIKDEKDLFTLDDRSYLFAELGYKPLPYLIVSMVYNWTFTPIRDADDNIIGYEPQKKIEPRISLAYPINL
jgi:hypothetical protein